MQEILTPALAALRINAHEQVSPSSGSPHAMCGPFMGHDGSDSPSDVLAAAGGPSSSGGDNSSLEHSPQDTQDNGVLDGLSGSPTAAGQNDMARAQDPSKQICYDFTKGLCTRGDKCKYSHDLATIVHFNSREKGICFDYLRNQCHRGLLCRFSHDLSNIAQQVQGVHAANAAAARGKTNAICYDFVKGVCQRGNECRYSHDLSLIARTARGGVQNQKSGEICYDYLRGRCNRGSSCKYSHNISFLAAPGFLASALNNTSSAPASGLPTLPLTSAGSLPQPGANMLSSMTGSTAAAMPNMGAGLPPAPQRLSSSLPNDASTLAAATSNGGGIVNPMATSLSSSLDLGNRPSLAGSLSMEVNDALTGRMDQPAAPGMWPQAMNGSNAALPPTAGQAAILNSFAHHQRQFAAAAAAASGMNGFGLQHAAAAAAAAAGLQQLTGMAGAGAAASGPMGAESLVGSSNASGFAAAAAMAAQQRAALLRQQQQGAVDAGLSGFAGAAASLPFASSSAAAAAAGAAAGTAAAQMARTHSAPMPVPSSLQLPLQGNGLVTAESLHALLSNLQADNPQLLADTLSGLAAAAQAQAQAQAVRAPSGGLPPMVPPSAPQPIPGRYERGSGAPSPALGSFKDGYQLSGSAAANCADQLSRTAPSMAAGALNGMSLSPELLPLLKEIWNK